MSDSDRAIQIWSPAELVRIPTSVRDPELIVQYADATLSKRDAKAIVVGFEAGSYEMVSTFVWTKASSTLKRQIATLGMEFVGEMLGRPDLSEESDPTLAIGDYEALSLAEDLGMITSTQGLRLKQSMQLVTHFVANSEADDLEEGMTCDEAVMLLRSCITSILGKPQFEAALHFADFRQRLASQSLLPDDADISAIVASPYFFCRTTISVLLSLIKTERGARQEHAVGNAIVVIPKLWSRLRSTERWQVGQCYAEVTASGDKIASTGLRKALVAVQGFDYVPESLRSNTFTEAASKVLSAHFAMNNFYNERGPMQTLASLGTSVPMPAFPRVMEAVLAIYVGNYYGHAFDAAPIAERMLKKLRPQQWQYYLNECLVRDKTMMDKLCSSGKPILRWGRLLRELVPDDIEIGNRKVADLIKVCRSVVSEAGGEKVKRAATKLRVDTAD